MVGAIMGIYIILVIFLIIDYQGYKRVKRELNCIWKVIEENNNRIYKVLETKQNKRVKK